MGKLANIVLGGIVAASLATSGCYEMIYVREQPRPRVIHQEHKRHEVPILIICYDWPDHNHYCHHPQCYDRYLIEQRNRNNQPGHREGYRDGDREQDRDHDKPFQYQPEKQAFPHEQKAERRGTVKSEVKKEKTEEKQKQPRKAFPKEENPKEYQKSFKKGPN